RSGSASRSPEQVTKCYLTEAVAFACRKSEVPAPEQERERQQRPEREERRERDLAVLRALGRLLPAPEQLPHPLRDRGEVTLGERAAAHGRSELALRRRASRVGGVLRLEQPLRVDPLGGVPEADEHCLDPGRASEPPPQGRGDEG